MLTLLKDYFWIFFISMLPLIELRGAVPVGVTMGYDFLPVYLVSVLGNMLPIPVILLLVKPVLLFMQKIKIFNKLATFFLDKGHNAGEKWQGSSKFFALFCFVAIPLPGTGAWTGALAASLLDLDKKKSFIAILGGVVTAGLIMGALSFGLLGAFTAIF